MLPQEKYPLTRDWAFELMRRNVRRTYWRTLLSSKKV